MKGSLQRFLRLPACLTLLILLPAPQPAGAQEAFHQFSNKDGQQIEARIVSVTPDWRTMKIERRDGAQFDMAVNVLSLDDQQVVKNWIRENPDGAKIDYNIDVEIEKKLKTVETKRRDDYKYKTMDASYEIEVKNRTRQPLNGARVDYVVVYEDRVSIYRTDTGFVDYSWFYGDDDSRGEIKYQRKSETLPATMQTNHSHTFLTEAVQHHQVFGDGNVSYGEDKILGVIFHVVGPDGRSLGEFRSPESYIQKVEWDQVKGSAFPEPGGRGKSGDTDEPDPLESGDSSSDSSSSAPPEISSGELPSWFEVRKLDEWPEILQKGDTVPSTVMPKWGQKPARITAHVDVDEDNSGGVIVACGGQLKGFSLFVLNDELHFWSRKQFENYRSETERISVPLSKLPENRFKVDAEYTRDRLRLWVNGELQAEGPSVGLLQYKPKEGLSVGYDSEDSAVGPAAPHTFRGRIQDVQVKFGGTSFAAGEPFSRD